MSSLDVDDGVASPSRPRPLSSPPRSSRMTSAPPTPLRPLCRTRRRSSSLSSVLPSTSSSPDRGAAWTQYRSSPTRGDAKRAKRTRVGYGGGDSASFQKPPSPLKQSQPALYPPPHEPDHVWTHPHPFGPAAAAAAALDPASSTTSSFGASINPQPLFCASAGAFALPGIDEATHERTRNPSTESSSFPSHASLSSSKSSFDDSSFASDSPPDSLPSPSTSPDTSLGSSALLAAACAPSTSSSSAFAAHPLPLVPPPLRRATSCTSPMQCDPAASPLSTSLLSLVRADELGEAERLHHVAFEHLRSATRDEEEHFVERMRRWEAARGDPFAAEPGCCADAAADDNDELELDDAADDDEIEVTLDLGSSARSLAHHAHAPPPVSRAELDELARRLQAGACELEDYALVREVQARSRSQSARV